MHETHHFQVLNTEMPCLPPLCFVYGSLSLPLGCILEDQLKGCSQDQQYLLWKMLTLMQEPCRRSSIVFAGWNSGKAGHAECLDR